MMEIPCSFEKSISLTKSVTKAIVHVCGLGLYEFMINGEKIGNKVLNPAKTNYNKIVLYDTYDVSGLAEKRRKCILHHAGQWLVQPNPKMVELADAVVRGKTGYDADAHKLC